MKANDNYNSNPVGTHVSNGTLVLCRKAMALVEQTKAALLSEWQDCREECKHLLQLALNEAEALAWQTDFPQLFFPILAAEKVQAVGNWQARQQLMHEARARLSRAG
jgi:hypothetical protein